MRAIIATIAALVILAIRYPQPMLSIALGVVVLFGLTLALAALIKNGKQ